MAPLARTLIALALAGLALAGCGKKNANVLPDTWEVSLARAGDAWIAKDWARTWTLCENAYAIASKARKQEPTLVSLDCLGEAALKQEQAAKALPFYTKFLADQGAAMNRHAARHRIRNNHAVLLYESGKPDEAIAALRETIAAADEAGTGITGPQGHPVYMTLVRNLAIAWYGAASGAEAKAWVRDIGGWLQEKLEADPANRIGAYRGSTKALEALIAIGERQAQESTPQWRRIVEEARGREEELEKHDPLWRRLCETVKIGEIGLVACMRELSGP
jgi:tetratricopeptide (TPR) repeat protein